MIHITKYLVSIKLHFVCFLIGFLLFMNIFYYYYFIPMAKRNRESVEVSARLGQCHQTRPNYPSTLSAQSP